MSVELSDAQTEGRGQEPDLGLPTAPGLNPLCLPFASSKAPAGFNAPHSPPILPWLSVNPLTQMGTGWGTCLRFPGFWSWSPVSLLVFFAAVGQPGGDVPGSGCATYSCGFLGTNCYFGAAKGVCQTLLGWESALGSLQPPRAATGAVCSW